MVGIEVAHEEAGGGGVKVLRKVARRFGQPGE
jgi:hypothetical protein